MCRWLERDPAGYQDGPSLYSYLGRNPMAGTDPSGKVANLIGAAIGAAVGGGVSIAVDLWNGDDINWSRAGKATVAGAIGGAVFAPWAGVATAYAGGGFVSAAVGVAAEGGVVAGLFSGFTYQVLNYWEGGDFNPVLIWQEAILGGVLAGKFQAVYGVGRAGLGAMMAKRNAQPGGVARPGPGVHYEGEGARLQTTAHGAERIAGLGATRGGVLDEAGIDLVRARGDVLYQADGATVRVLQIESGRFNVVVEGERGIITTFERLSKKSLDRLSSRYGWKCD